MAWKQDLAKLKQTLGPEEAAAAPPKPPPKPVTKPERPASLDDEDAVFLSAMGLKPASPKPARAADPAPPAPAADPAPAPPPPPPPPETFQEALKDLKGLKPLSKGLPQRSRPAAKAPAPPPSPAPPPPEPEPTPAPAPPPGPAAGGPDAPALPAPPVRFQLAAGMALEVDGVLDLRGHSPEDAIERLKDRLGDGQVLGWRSLQVLLGPDPRLHDELLAFLASGEAPMVSRYAQAPVPMGGSQAWLLYFAAPSALP